MKWQVRKLKIIIDPIRCEPLYRLIFVQKEFPPILGYVKNIIPANESNRMILQKI